MKVFIFQTKDILRFQENFVFKERVMSLLKIFKENREVFKVRVFTENTSQNILLRVEVNINLLVEVLIDFIFVIVVKIWVNKKDYIEKDQEIGKVSGLKVFVLVKLLVVVGSQKSKIRKKVLKYI